MSVNHNVFPVSITGEDGLRAVGGIKFDPRSRDVLSITSNRKLVPGNVYACEITCSNLLGIMNPKERYFMGKIIKLIKNKGNSHFEYEVRVF